MSGAIASGGGYVFLLGCDRDSWEFCEACSRTAHLTGPLLNTEGVTGMYGGGISC